MTLGLAYGQGGGAFPTDPTITDFSNAGHDHVDLASGGVLDHNDLIGIGVNSHIEIDDHIAAVSAHGVTGNIIGSTGAQTLTQKTLITPIIASFLNAGHDHADAAGGAQIDHVNLLNVGANTHVQLDSHLSASIAHGVASDIVGTTDTQSLSGKTLITPTIASFLNAGHDHLDAAGGGTIAHTVLTAIGVNSHAQLDTHLSTSIAHGVASALVGITDTQTLSGKTLVLPIIASFLNATHDHLDAAGGGTIAHTVLTAIGVNTHAQIDTHLADAALHFTEASIDHTAIANIGTNTHAQLDTHVADGTVHFTEASIDHTAIANRGSNSHAMIDSHLAATVAHGAAGAVVGTTNSQTLTNKTLTTPVVASFLNAGHDHSNAAGGGQVDHAALLNDGSNTHAQLDTHLANAALHFTEASIDHTAIANIGTNTHAQLDTHLANAALHFTEASIDHTAIANIGTNSHAQIDTHVADATVHFTEASIDHTALLGIGFTNHDDIDDHIAAVALHFSEGSIDHTAISNIGTNTHAQLDTHLAATAAHGATGAVVGTTNSQTLTNKTLTTPTIASLTNAQHDHADAAGGGRITRIVTERISDIFDRSKGTMTIKNDGPTLGLEWGITETLRLYWKIPDNIDTSFNPETYMELHMSETQTASTSMGYKWIAGSVAKRPNASVASSTESFTTNFVTDPDDTVTVNEPLEIQIGKFTWGATALLVTGGPISVSFSYNRRNPDAGATPTGTLVLTALYIKYRVFVT